jgi:adenylosuccinate synthase
MPGWSESTVNCKSYDDLPINAKNYLVRIEELTMTPVDIISTGPDRDETIVVRDPFK